MDMSSEGMLLIQKAKRDIQRDHELALAVLHSEGNFKHHISVVEKRVVHVDSKTSRP